jgi:glycosyltransferase involved in cell wall biosynthesis
MRVTQVVPSLAPESGGPAENVPRLCAALAARGLEVEMHTIGEPQQASPPGVSMRVAAGAWPARIGRSPALARALRDVPADLIHAHCLWMLPLGYAAQAARARGVPLVISPRGMLAEWALRRSRFKKLLARFLLHPGAFEQAAGWHATSEQEAAEIRGQGFQQPICVSPNGIEASSEDVSHVRDVYLRLAPELAGRRIALFYSRFHPKKRVRELLLDFAALAAAHGEWHLLVAGIPEEWSVAVLRAEVQRLGLASRVTVLDGRGLPKPYALSELFVLPTHNENFGRVVAEALAAGVPVLTTTGTPWSGIESVRGGRWVPLEALRGALGELMALRPTELREMGARGRTWVLEHYAWPAVVRPLAEFYRELLEESR